MGADLGNGHGMHNIVNGGLRIYRLCSEVPLFLQHSTNGHIAHSHVPCHSFAGNRFSWSTDERAPTSSVCAVRRRLPADLGWYVCSTHAFTSSSLLQLSGSFHILCWYLALK